MSGAAPTITAVENNYSYFIPGTPNYAIAPGALFILKGTGMAAAATQPQLWNLSQSPLPLTSPAANGTSVSVTVGTANVNCGIYYVSPTQVAAVLPSTTPTGSATFTVTYNGQSGSISNIPIGTGAMGFDTLYGIGVGEGVATTPPAI
ncbi:MAG TPA: IPT/TIG domain-containing protein [Bryobacteraceae bacterium]